MRFVFGSLACFSLFLAPVAAQEIHIVSADGSVSVLRGDGAGAIPRGLNATLVTDDRIVTGDKSKAEVRVDAVHSVEVGAAAEVRMGEVYPEHYQFILEKGSLTWRVADSAASVAEVQTPSVGVRPYEPGVYTIAINAKGETEIVPREGNIEVFAPGGSQWVRAGEKMTARGPASNPEFQIAGRSKWRRLVSMLSKMQFGAVVDSFASSDSGQKPERKNLVNAPAHGGNPRVSSPESNHPPAAGGRDHASAPQHSASASQHGGSAPAGSHSSSSGSTAAASHSAPSSSSSTSSSHSK